MKRGIIRCKPGRIAHGRAVKDAEGDALIGARALVKTP